MNHCSLKRFLVLLAALGLVVVATSESWAQHRHRGYGHHHISPRHHGRYHGYSNAGISLRIGGAGVGFYSRNYNNHYGYRLPVYYSGPVYRPAYRPYGGVYGRPGCGGSGIYIGW